MSEMGLVFLLYKIITLIVSTLIVYWGVLLFRTGVYDKSGDIEAIWGDNKLILKRATPGTILILFGTFAIVFSMFKGINLEYVGTDSNPVVPTQVQKIIGKIVNDEKISKSEKTILSMWNSMHKNDRKHYFGYREPKKKNDFLPESNLIGG